VIKVLATFIHNIYE